MVPIKDMPALHVLPAGPTPLNPAELLASGQMAQLAARWREEYEFIIIDGVPVLPVTDSVLLSNYADLTLLLARYKMTERQSLERSCSILESQGNHQIRIVFNGVQPKDNTYRRYYGYKNSKSYGKAQHG
ncbi:MAG TPA: hypothetical protein VH351_09925 [Bryobacteraceae bacterium]|nr:hypothetical protein [Bryobacteraceae bacterium]